MALALELLPFSSFVVFLEVGRSIFQNSSKCLWLPRCWGKLNKFSFSVSFSNGFYKTMLYWLYWPLSGCSSLLLDFCMYVYVYLAGPCTVARFGHDGLWQPQQPEYSRCEKYRDLIKAVISMFFLLLSSFPNSFWVRKSAFESQKGRCLSVIAVNDG